MITHVGGEHGRHTLPAAATGAITGGIINGAVEVADAVVAPALDTGSRAGTYSRRAGEQATATRVAGQGQFAVKDGPGLARAAPDVAVFLTVTDVEVGAEQVVRRVLARGCRELGAA